MRLLAALTALGLAATFAAEAQVHVNGYVRKDGSYVQPHYRSAPDNSRLNNWSTQGNANPYTGAEGTRAPYPSYNSGFKPIETPKALIGGTRNRNIFGQD